MDQENGVHLNGEEKTLLTLKGSRKAFVAEYGCGLLSLVGLGILYLKGIAVPTILNYFMLGFSVFSIGSAEYSRLVTRYRLTPSKLVIIKGIIKQHKKNVYYHPLAFIPDLNTKQSRIQRILNYGTIFVNAGGNSFELKNISKPLKMVGVIEELIGHKR